MSHVVRISLVSLAMGFLSQLAQIWLGTSYLNDYLSANLLTVLIALLAINSTTTGIVLTKIRELVEARGGSSAFEPTKAQMLLAVREQIFLVGFSVVFLMVASSPLLTTNFELKLLIDSLVVGIFVYALHVLYDTAISVLIIISFDPNEHDHGSDGGG